VARKARSDAADQGDTEPWPNMFEGDWLTPAEMEQMYSELQAQGLSGSKLEDAWTVVIQEGSSKSATRLTESVLRKARKTLRFNKAFEAGFEDRLADRWKPAFDLYRVTVGSAQEVGEDYGRHYGPTLGANAQIKLEALQRQHARACLSANEVLALLRSGYPAGAGSRWRTIHELGIVASILAENGPDISQRYLDFAWVQRLKDARDYQRFAARLSHEPLTDEVIREITERRDLVCAKYEPAFSKDNGWAAPLFPPKAQITIRGLEELAQLDHLRPPYNLSSHATHAGPRASELNFITRGDETSRLVGAMNAGFSEVAHEALISLIGVTVALLIHGTGQPQLKEIVFSRVLLNLTDRAGDRFAKIERQIAKDEKRFQARQRKRRRLK
jgi:Family of unknown function (DUF5677)